MRFSIRELLIVVAVCAFAMVSLVRATPIYSTLFFSFTMLMIVASILMAVGSIAGARAYWIGFAISSGLYMYYAHIPDAQGNAPRQTGPEFTTQLLRLAFEKLHPEPDATQIRTSSQDSDSPIMPLRLRAPILGLVQFNSETRRQVFGSGLFSVQDEIDNSKKDNEQVDHKILQEKVKEPDFESLIDLIQTTIQPKSAKLTEDSDGTTRYQSNLSLVVRGGQQVHPDPPDRSHFMSIGHSAFALLFGWIGGYFTCFVYERSRKSAQEGPPKSKKMIKTD